VMNHQTFDENSSIPPTGSDRICDDRFAESTANHAKSKPHVNAMALEILSKIQRAQVRHPRKLIIASCNDARAKINVASDISAAAAATLGRALLVSEDGCLSREEFARASYLRPIRADSVNPELYHQSLPIYLAIAAKSERALESFSTIVVDLSAPLIRDPPTLACFHDFSAILIAYPGSTTQLDLKRGVVAFRAAEIPLVGIVTQHCSLRPPEARMLSKPIGSSGRALPRGNRHDYSCDTHV